MPIKTLEDRFWAKVERGAPDDCWIWRGSIWDGYGRIKTDEGVRGAHRVLFEIEVGPVPEGLVLDHLCRNRACVNPAHLEAVTPAENTRRGDLSRPRLTHCKRGHPLVPGNIKLKPGGKRQCEKCYRVAVRRSNVLRAIKRWVHRQDGTLLHDAQGVSTRGSSDSSRPEAMPATLSHPSPQ